MTLPQVAIYIRCLPRVNCVISPQIVFYFLFCSPVCVNGKSPVGLCGSITTLMLSDHQQTDYKLVIVL